MELNELQDDVAQIVQLKRQIAIWRGALTVTIVAAVIISVSVLWTSVNTLAKPGPGQQKFLGVMTDTFTKDVPVQLKEIGSRAVKAADLNKRMQELNAAAPQVTEEAMKQARELATNIPEKGRMILADNFKQQLMGHEAKLRELFPEAREEQIKALLEGMADETKDSVVTLTDSLFQPHITTMNKIITDVDTIKSSEHPNVDEIPTWDMAFLIIDITRSDFDMPKPAPAKPATTKPTKAGKGTK